jgi:hypothetical protein
MSHFTTIKTQIVAQEPLKKALADLGLACEEGAVEIRGYGGNRTRVDIRVPTSNAGYDLGFRKQGETYELIADWWGIKDLKQDTFLQRLTQRYAYHVAKEQLAAQDFTVVEEEVQADNTIHLVVRRMVW